MPMDVLNSPLNLAHQYGRKAYKLLEANKYDSAIECHQKAKACLAEAMLTTSDKRALESLRLQESRHDQQEALVRQRQSTVSLANHTPLTQKGNKVVPPVPRSESCRYSESGAETGEYDTLLHFLDDRMGTHRPPAKEPDLSIVVRQLRVDNTALRQRVCELGKESDSQRHLVEQLRTENASLHARIAQLERTDAHSEFESQVSPLPLDMNVDDLASLPLAPLEMPHFDFDSLTPRKVSTDGQSENQGAG